MKTVIRLFLLCLGFAGATLISYYFDPGALDSVGFFLFYLALALGIANLFLLLRLSALQAILLTFLALSFLALRQAGLFNGWLGVGLIIIVIFIERVCAKK